MGSGAGLGVPPIPSAFRLESVRKEDVKDAVLFPLLDQGLECVDVSLLLTYEVCPLECLCVHDCVCVVHA